jgi:hypothetical protein
MNGVTKTGFSTISLERLQCARWDSSDSTERRRRRRRRIQCVNVAPSPNIRYEVAVDKLLYYTAHFDLGIRQT